MTVLGLVYLYAQAITLWLKTGAKDAGAFAHQKDYEIVLDEDITETFVKATTMAGEDNGDDAVSCSFYRILQSMCHPTHVFSPFSFQQPRETESERKHKSLQEVRRSLPVFKFRQQFLDAVNQYQILIIVGETGSGKTTQLPQYLHEEGYTKR